MNSGSTSIQRVCAITGGSSGIGLECAKVFAAQDYAVSICGRNSDRLQRAAAKIPSQHLLTLKIDLADSEAAAGFIKQTVGQFARLDVLINCAAEAPLASLVDFPATEFESAIDTNIRGLFYATQAAWRQFLMQGAGGIIINISSLAAIDPFPGLSVYGACKAWMDLLTVALGAEGRPHGIRVFSIRPGAVDTPMLNGLFPEFPADQRLAPADVARLAWSLCGDSFQHSSGQAINIRRPL